MTGKRKKSGKKGKRRRRREKRDIDEYQLRRDLREQARQRESEALERMTMLTEEEILQYAENMRIGGIEGGGTHSTLVIFDGKGTKLTDIKGPDTNHWFLGMEETIARLSAMIERGKQAINMPENVPLECVGLSLSGCEEEATNRLLRETLIEKFPASAKDYLVCSDTLGSLRTALDNGGIVLISGTGSNALLINPDGETHGCGGWGYRIGDEGSAYWIAYRACKYVFDDIDDFAKSPEPTSFVWPAMRNYFNIPDRKSMLPHLYTDFDKSKIASFTKQIVIGCEKEDALCLELFREAGQLLARHIVALSKKAHNDLKLANGGLKVICVGSVWKSWQYLKKGFVDEIHKSRIIDELSLLRLTASSALGAAYLAAEKIGLPFTKPYEENAEIFYHYRRNILLEAKTAENLEPSDPLMVSCNNKSVKEDERED